jgi:hypothetical protein
MPIFDVTINRTECIVFRVDAADEDDAVTRMYEGTEVSADTYDTEVVTVERLPDRPEPQVARLLQAPFTAPEFYADLVATITDGTRTVIVQRDGEAMLWAGDVLVADPGEFRATFPDGALPETGWKFNAWFDAYEVLPDGELFHLDLVAYDVHDAVFRVLDAWDTL